MGNDGGSIPDRRDLVKSKPKAEQADRQNQMRARWFSCALSKRPLQEPIVSCALGKLYNKDALLEYLLDKSAFGDGAEICGHIRSLKDVKTLKLTPNPTPVPPESDAAVMRVRSQFVCPLTFKEMTGTTPFVYVASCGCVFSAVGLKTLARKSSPKDDEQSADREADVEKELCPQCGSKFSPADVRTINPGEEEAERMGDAMLIARAAEPVKSKGKKRKKDATTEEAAPADAKKAKKTVEHNINPSVAAASRAVVAGLAMEEAKRKAAMSDAVRSLYADKDAPKRKETFMTMGTFTRYA